MVIEISHRPKCPARLVWCALFKIFLANSFTYKAACQHGPRLRCTCSSARDLCTRLAEGLFHSIQALIGLAWEKLPWNCHIEVAGESSWQMHKLLGMLQKFPGQGVWNREGKVLQPAGSVGSTCPLTGLQSICACWAHNLGNTIHHLLPSWWACALNYLKYINVLLVICFCWAFP